MAALSRSMPPSAHSMRQSPGAISGSASTTSRAVEAAAADDLVELLARALVQRVVHAHHHMRASSPGCGSSRWRAPRSRRAARAPQVRARASWRPRPPPRPPRFRAWPRPRRGRLPSAVERRRDALDRSGARAARLRPRPAPCSKPRAKAGGLRLLELGGVLVERRSTACARRRRRSRSRTGIWPAPLSLPSPQ